MTSGWTGVNVSLSSSDLGGTLGEKSLTLTNAKKIIVTWRLAKLCRPRWDRDTDWRRKTLSSLNFFFVLEPEQGVSQSWHKAGWGHRGDIEQASLSWEISWESTALMAKILSYLSDQDPGQADSRVAPNGNLLHLNQFSLRREKSIWVLSSSN